MKNYYSQTYHFTFNTFLFSICTSLSVFLSIYILEYKFIFDTAPHYHSKFPPTSSTSIPLTIPPLAFWLSYCIYSTFLIIQMNTHHHHHCYYPYSYPDSFLSPNQVAVYQGQIRLFNYKCCRPFLHLSGIFYLKFHLISIQTQYVFPSLYLYSSLNDWSC